MQDTKFPSRTSHCREIIIVDSGFNIDRCVAVSVDENLVIWCKKQLYQYQQNLNHFLLKFVKISRHDLALRQLKSHQSCLKEDTCATFEKIPFTVAIQGKSVAQGNSIFIVIASLAPNHFYICIHSRYCI